MTSGRILAVDFGRRRTGVAVSDEHCSIATPTRVITSRNRRQVAEKIAELAKALDAVRIVVGDPVRLDGTDGDLHADVVELARDLEQLTGLPVVLFNEGLTSWEAGQRAKFVSKQRKRCGTLDAMAAAVLLEDYLDDDVSKHREP